MRASSRSSASRSSRIRCVNASAPLRGPDCSPGAGVSTALAVACSVHRSTWATPQSPCRTACREPRCPRHRTPPRPSTRTPSPLLGAAHPTLSARDPDRLRQDTMGRDGRMLNARARVPRALPLGRKAAVLPNGRWAPSPAVPEVSWRRSEGGRPPDRLVAGTRALHGKRKRRAAAHEIARSSRPTRGSAASRRGARPGSPT